MQLRWKYYQYAAGLGTRPELRVDDSSVINKYTTGVPQGLKIIRLSPINEMTNTPFSIIVRSVRFEGGEAIATDVAQPCNVSVEVESGSGSLSGMAAGTIIQGSNNIMFRDLAYDSIGQATFRACDNSGFGLGCDLSAAVFTEGPSTLVLGTICDKVHFSLA